MKQVIDVQKMEALARSVGAEDILIPQIINRARILEAREGQYIMNAGEPITWMLILVKGILRIHSISESGKTSTVAYSEPPQMLGDIEFIQKASSLHNVIAETDAVFIGIPIEDVRRYLSDNISFYKMICRNLINKLYKTSEDYSKVLLYPAKVRFARHLISNGYIEGPFKLNSSRTAELLGITPRHMSRIITSMVEDGILKRNSAREYLVANRKELEMLSEFLSP